MILSVLLIGLFASTFADVDNNNNATCPLMKEGDIGVCLEECSFDQDCPDGQKCCSNGCGHICRKPCYPVVRKCEFGTIFFHDPNGCLLSACKEDPCATIECPTFKTCQINPSNNSAVCVNKHCPSSVPKCDCQELTTEYFINRQGCLVCQCIDCNCRDSKKLSVKVNVSDGCELKRCACVDPCEDACPIGYTCELKQIDCPESPCPTVPQCVPKTNPCRFGFPLANKNCSDNSECPDSYICNNNPVDGSKHCCQNDPCNNKCKNEQNCLIKADCISKPCRQKSSCVSKKCPKRKCLKTKCIYGYSYDQYGCRTCNCLEPCKDKICKNGKSCMVLNAPICTDRECPEYYGLCV